MGDIMPDGTRRQPLNQHTLSRKGGCECVTHILQTLTTSTSSMECVHTFSGGETNVGGFSGWNKCVCDLSCPVAVHQRPELTDPELPGEHGLPRHVVLACEGGRRWSDPARPKPFRQPDIPVSAQNNYRRHTWAILLHACVFSNLGFTNFRWVSTWNECQS